jgi:hypothetical protein
MAHFRYRQLWVISVSDVPTATDGRVVEVEILDFV